MKLLIVSFSNICRGPMAAGLARKIAQERGVSLEVETAGMAAHSKAPVPAAAIEAMAQAGVDISRHQPKPVASHLLAWADVVLGLERDLTLGLRLQYPDAAEKILDLDSEIRDPRRPGATLEDYAACRDRLESLLRHLEIYTDRSRRDDTAAARCAPHARARNPRDPQCMSTGGRSVRS
jgi:protein-tyrosine-phosphatase